MVRTRVHYLDNPAGQPGFYVRNRKIYGHGICEYPWVRPEADET